MRIGISAIYRMRGGSLTHIRQLLRAWSAAGVDREHEIVLFAREEAVAMLRDALSPHVIVRRVGGRSFGPLRKLLWEQFRFGRVLRDEKIDVLFCTANLIPLFTRTPTVVALRNAGPFCASMTIRHVGWRLWAYMKFLGILMRVCAARAARLIFVSDHFRREFQRRGFRGKHCDVIYHGRDAGGARARSAGPRTMLFVGNLYRYKNVTELIEAYAIEREFFVREGLRLLIVGEPVDAAYASMLRNAVAHHRLEDQIVFTGKLRHEEILEAMDACELFVFQSTCENCPNTLIEALAKELPIVCSNVSVMPEIAGDAAEYFDPGDPRDIARAMRRVLEDPAYAAALSERAAVQALRFPKWDEVGRRTLDSLLQAAKS